MQTPRDPALLCCLYAIWSLNSFKSLSLFLVCQTPVKRNNCLMQVILPRLLGTSLLIAFDEVNTITTKVNTRIYITCRCFITAFFSRRNDKQELLTVQNTNRSFLCNVSWRNGSDNRHIYKGTRTKMKQHCNCSWNV